MNQLHLAKFLYYNLSTLANPPPTFWAPQLFPGPSLRFLATEWQRQRKVVKTVHQHFLVWISLDTQDMRLHLGAVRHRKGGGGGRLVLPQNMGSTRIFALGGSEGQDRGHR